MKRTMQMWTLAAVVLAVSCSEKNDEIDNDLGDPPGQESTVRLTKPGLTREQLDHIKDLFAKGVSREKIKTVENEFFVSNEKRKP